MGSWGKGARQEGNSMCPVLLLGAFREKQKPSWLEWSKLEQCSRKLGQQVSRGRDSLVNTLNAYSEGGRRPIENFEQVSDMILQF